MVIPFVALWVSVWGPLHAVASQEAAVTGDESARLLAPAVPFESRELPLLAVEREGRLSGERPLEVIRYGQRGSLRRPVALDLPVVGQAVVLEAWDWLRATDRALALIESAEYVQWILLDPDTQGVILSDRRFELFRGTVRWSGEDEAFTRSVVTVGDLTVTGRGRARIRHDGYRIELIVERGRFEITRGDTLIAVASAGQERYVEFDAAFAMIGPGDVEAFAERRAALGGALDDALMALLADGMLDGDTLARLWEATLRFGPVFASVEADRAAWVSTPEVVRADIGEALRLLRAYDFRPPPAAGM